MDKCKDCIHLKEFVRQLVNITLIRCIRDDYKIGRGNKSYEK